MDSAAPRRMTAVQFLAAFFAWIASPLLLTGLLYLVSMALFAVTDSSAADTRLEYFAPLVIIAALACWLIGPLVLALVLRSRLPDLTRGRVWRMILGWLAGMVAGASFATYQIFHFIFGNELNPGLHGTALSQYIKFTVASIPVVLLALWIASTVNMVLTLRSAEPDLPRKDLWLVPLLWGLTFGVLGYFLFQSELSLIMLSAMDYVSYETHWFRFLETALLAVTVAWGLFGALGSLWLFFRLNHIFKLQAPVRKTGRVRAPRASTAD